MKNKQNKSINSYSQNKRNENITQTSSLKFQNQS
jgi:hypothetical protein